MVEPRTTHLGDVLVCVTKAAQARTVLPPVLPRDFTETGNKRGPKTIARKHPT